MQFFGEGRKFEEIGFFFGFYHFASAVGTFAVHKLRIGPETFTGFAIFAAVFAFVNVAFIVQGFEDVLHGFDMIVVGGADKTVIRNVDVFPEFFEFGDHTVCIFLRGKAGGFGFVFDFLAMLVGSVRNRTSKPLARL